MALSPVLSTTVLGKRKAVESLVLHLASSPEPSASYAPSDSEFDIPDVSKRAKPSTGRPILVNGSLVVNTKRRYQCTYERCEKAYTKPSRLEEHERSHTGDRPFVCETCHKSYLRETHLQAHARSHLPESARPFECSQPDCGKRFWTSQHLRVHEDMHQGAKPFQCTEPACSESFSKHHQLRSHVISVHAPPGTKPYQCSHSNCSKSFSTNQKLRAHTKIHNAKRYTCVHPTCVPNSGNPPTYYSTWTALQHHTRTAHPPTCTHPSCNNRTFASQHGLRAHLKLHEQRDKEGELDTAVASDDDNDRVHNRRPMKKRRGGELDRDWKCDIEGCTKDFKSKQALTIHMNVTHLGRRDHICPRPTCARAFGYKHLLQRHLAKVHSIHSSSEAQETSGSSDDDETEHETPRMTKKAFAMDIDTITGKTYATQAEQRLHTSKALKCPFPYFQSFLPTASIPSSSTASPCGYVYTRAYDLRRHLKAEHQIEAEKEAVDNWVNDAKRAQRGS